MARSEGVVRQLLIQQVPTNGDNTRLKTILKLDRNQASALIETLRALDGIPIEDEKTVHVDDQLLRGLFADPTAIPSLYAQDPKRFRAQIEDDADAEDVIALRHRRNIVQRMREWLYDEDAFNTEAQKAGGQERAWQRLLEDNPWILGIGLGGQLLTSWDTEQLEQTVKGFDIKGVGKKADALLRTRGTISSLTFAEIKHHRTRLLDSKEYRAGCWGPSKELTGAVIQAQQTVHMARNTLDDYLPDTSEDGEQLPSGTFTIRPRSFVIAGTLEELTGATGRPIPEKFRSFEMFRRNLQAPEVVTFDELVARAEWHVESAAGKAAEHSQETTENPPSTS
ncbi:Shedu immune nuclease family protein [Actinopolyspora mortivallis]|uniref:Shedu immune nuclease family protein n=1 Tax=Actinopolyspora mortivallis TaxID=33906 RepID=UPI001C62657A|nr:Shedu immune nuclease family protein [Actinopolyspora mortivallis]